MRNHVVVLFVLAALFGAACSAAEVEQNTSSVVTDAESSSASETQPEPTAETAAEPDATEVPEPVESAATDDGQEPAAAAETSSAAALLGTDDWCVAAAQIETLLDGDDVTDPVALEESYGTATVLVREAVRIAPPEIAPDVAAMAQALVAFSSLLEEAEWSFLDVDLAAMEEVAVSMDDPGYNIEKYNFEVCGIGEDPGAPFESSSGDFDEPLPQGTARELMVETMVNSGFTETEALCLADRLDFTDPEALTSPLAVQAAFEECGISLDRLSQIGG